MLKVVKDTDKGLLLAIAPTDAKGNAAKIDGKPAWGVSDAAVVALEAADDGMSCKALVVGPTGSATITVTADADLGEGVKQLSDSLDVVVDSSEATSLGISVSELA